MATLTTKLTLTSSSTSDSLNLSVSDTLTVTHPQVGISKIAVTTVGANNIIIPSVDARRYFYGFL